MVEAGETPAQEQPFRMRVFLGPRASCPLQRTGGLSQHLWACGPLAGGTPALPAAGISRFASPRASRRDRRTPPWEHRRPPGTAGIPRLPHAGGRLARLNTPEGFRNTCGSATHLRAGRPRSREQPFRVRVFLGPRASCPLQHTGGPFHAVNRGANGGGEGAAGPGPLGGGANDGRRGGPETVPLIAGAALYRLGSVCGDSAESGGCSALEKGETSGRRWQA